MFSKPFNWDSYVDSDWTLIKKMTISGSYNYPLLQYCKHEIINWGLNTTFSSPGLIVEDMKRSSTSNKVFWSVATLIGLALGFAIITQPSR